MNIKVSISYDGSGYLGSQRQPNGLSVEDRLQRAFSSLNIYSPIMLSGRTDKNVHALGQVFNIHIPSYWKELSRLKNALNKALPLSIRVRDICCVDDQFHARFDAKKRIYRFFVTNQENTPFNANYIVHFPTINPERIQQAVKYFEGEHDFEFFHKKGSDKEFLKKIIYEARFYHYKGMYIFKFKANSYLRSQIRLMVGFLLRISQGRFTLEDLKDQLSKRRYTGHYLVDAHGLYLAKVIY